TALIDIVEKEWNGDQWFITHDTARFGPTMIANILSKGPTDSHRALLKDGWLNMGLFSKKYITELAPYILSLKNCNKMQAILSERLYNRFDTSGFYD
ncbi:hypothetical protein, partial [Klebsiella pneumoniae]|uniref:hypothetical protein n=1 Tax=Klebsiella pneumoniae TaxID=573 RepID=UPI003853604D